MVIRWEVVPNGLWQTRTLTLDAKVGQPRLTCETSSVVFSKACLYHFASKKVTLRNQGDAKLEWLVQLDPSLPVTVVPSSGTIRATGSQLIRLIFRPTELTDLNLRVTIHSDGGNLSINCSGSVSLPQLMVTEMQNLDFGIVRTNRRVLRSFTLQNNGNSRLDYRIGMDNLPVVPYVYPSVSMAVTEESSSSSSKDLPPDETSSKQLLSDVPSSSSSSSSTDLSSSSSSSGSLLASDSSLLNVWKSVNEDPKMMDGLDPQEYDLQYRKEEALVRVVALKLLLVACVLLLSLSVSLLFFSSLCSSPALLFSFLFFAFLCSCLMKTNSFFSSIPSRFLLLPFSFLFYFYFLFVCFFFFSFPLSIPFAIFLLLFFLFISVVRRSFCVCVVCRDPQ
jgi:hypothetical protein